MFWIIVLHLTTSAGQDVPVAGPPVAFINPRECASAVEILRAAGQDRAECRTVKVLSNEAEAF